MGRCGQDRLVFDGGQSAEPVLPATAVVGPFDPGEDRDPQLLAGLPHLAVRTFFCRREKKDTMAALSAAEPSWPIEPIIE